MIQPNVIYGVAGWRRSLILTSLSCGVSLGSGKFTGILGVSQALEMGDPPQNPESLATSPRYGPIKSREIETVEQGTSKEEQGLEIRGQRAHSYAIAMLNFHCSY